MTTKLITMTLLAVVSLILGFLPLKIGKYFFNDDKIWKRTFTSVLLCFGGGVLFATSFIHMLPEVRENIEESGIDFGGVPMAEILTCAGFFFIYFIEESVHFFLDSGVHHHHDETIQVHQSFSIHSAACEAGLIDIQKCASPRVGESPRNTRRKRTISYPSTTTNYKTFYSKELESNANFAGTSATLKKIAEATASNSSPDESCQNDASPYTKSSLRDFFTVLALSFHAVFEGLAVGLETDSKDVWLLFAAVATHKYVISFCVGLELCNARTRLLIYSAYMIIFAIMSPIGIGIGIIITSNSGTGSAYFLVVAILQALAGGTIIYVVVFEVLERERSKNVSGLAQLFFVILGFCVLMAVEILAGHDHNHSHDDEHEHTNVTTILQATTLLKNI